MYTSNIYIYKLIYFNSFSTKKIISFRIGKNFQMHVKMLSPEEKRINNNTRSTIPCRDLFIKHLSHEYRHSQGSSGETGAEKGEKETREQSACYSNTNGACQLARSTTVKNWLVTTPRKYRFWKWHGQMHCRKTKLIDCLYLRGCSTYSHV